MAHAKLSASKAARWMACPGSIRLSEGIVEVESSYAAEGTAAHAMAAAQLLNEPAHVGSLEMYEAVNFYVEYVRDLKTKGACHVEVNLTPALQRVDKDFGGTADCIVWDREDRILHVIDYKHGRGVAVDAEDNAQLKMYALGALLACDYRPLLVHSVIIQPRLTMENLHIRESLYAPADLLDFIGDARVAAAATRNPGASLHAGDHCKFCPAKVICPELERHQHAITEIDLVTNLPSPIVLGKLLDQIGAVEDRIKAIREYAYAEAKQGRAPSGYKLVAKLAKRQWVSEADVTEWAQAHAIEPFEQAPLKSPAQLEKGLAKELKLELAAFTETKSSGDTLVPLTDKRAAITAAAKVEDFNVVPSKENQSE